MPTCDGEVKQPRQLAPARRCCWRSTFSLLGLLWVLNPSGLPLVSLPVRYFPTGYGRLGKPRKSNPVCPACSRNVWVIRVVLGFRSSPMPLSHSWMRI